jgi:seryl-tRNA synthetase
VADDWHRRITPAQIIKRAMSRLEKRGKGSILLLHDIHPATVAALPGLLKELKDRLGYATSFRKEAGAAGKDMEGIIRLHQFDKLEMESFATKETAHQEHLFFSAIQERLMQLLEIPYRKLQKCTYDIGKPNAKGSDLEAWLPGQNKYRETHTADYMTDYQARRLNTRVRRSDGSLEHVHTNDATAFACGRTLIAIIENYQKEDMTVGIPTRLQPYMGGRSVLYD